MKPHIRNQKDFAAGLVYVVAGLGFALGALNYKLGDAARMGPGWFPFWVGLILAVVGALNIAASVRVRAENEKLERPDIRAMAWVLGAVVVFGLLLQPLGLILSLIALVLVSSLGSHEFGWKGALVNAAVLTLFSVGAFIYGIHLQIPMWPAFVS